MSPHVHALLLQRERAHQKIIAVTTASAAGAVALAAAFGVVLGTAHPTSAAVAPSGDGGPRTAPPAVATPPVQRVDAVSGLSAASPPAVPAQVDTRSPASPPASHHTAPSRATRPAASTTHAPLRPPATVPRPADDESAQAPSGAS
jgi:hypothetical protein